LAIGLPWAETRGFYFKVMWTVLDWTPSRTQLIESAQRVRHQSFTAGLVYCPPAFFDHDDLESGLRAV
jgi:hypothetical protein